MIRSVAVNRMELTDLDMYQCGTQDCEPGHAYGPAVRDHFLIHYAKRGKGIFQVGNKTYHLKAGQGFLICPGIVTFYQADMEDPWHYSWVGFHGLKAEAYLKMAGLSAENPVFTYDRDDFVKNCFDQMYEARNVIHGREMRLLGHLYLFLSRLVEMNGSMVYADQNINRKELYIKKAIEYIERNYSRKFSIAEIAAHIGLDRSYLGSLFKEYLNTSPQEYLIKFRVGKASELFQNTNLTVGDISRSVGYDDPLLFSKIFKKATGSCPREYRNKLTQDSLRRLAYR